MTDTASSWNDWIGADVVGGDGKKFGTLDAIYMDWASGQPEWLVVTTGLFGAKRTFVPLPGATADGEALRVPYPKSLMKDAPGISDDNVLSSEEEARLYAHYGRDDYEPYDIGREGAGFGDSGEDTSSPTTDDAMTRSEEEVQVGTRSVETGRVRLRKYVATEHVTTTVPVRKKKVRVEREPITDANQDRA